MVEVQTGGRRILSETDPVDWEILLGFAGIIGTILATAAAVLWQGRSSTAQLRSEIKEGSARVDRLGDRVDRLRADVTTLAVYAAHIVGVPAWSRIRRPRPGRYARHRIRDGVRQTALTREDDLQRVSKGNTLRARAARRVAVSVRPSRYVQGVGVEDVIDFHLHLRQMQDDLLIVSKRSESDPTDFLSFPRPPRRLYFALDKAGWAWVSQPSARPQSRREAWHGQVLLL